MQVDKLTIATTHTEAMVKFYNNVFDANMVAIRESPLYVGRLGDVELMFCPNTLLQIKAEKNRIQFRLVNDDLEVIVRKASVNGGGIYGERTETDTRITWGIYDPDGNSIELIQHKADA